MSKPKPEIPVFACCGMFGWCIPWAVWMAYDPPVCGTRDVDRFKIYLYSGTEPRVNPDDEYRKKHICLCIDDFMSEQQPPDWDYIYDKIVEAANA